MTEQELKQWAWNWAIRLNGDLGITPVFFEEAEEISKKQKDPLTCAKILCWPVAAYYEYLSGSWSRERAEKQIYDAISLLRGAQFEKF